MRAIERRLRERVKALEKDLEEVRLDRDLYREHFHTRFRWWIELIGQQKTPSLSWLIESDAKWLQKFRWWGW